VYEIAIASAEPKLAPYFAPSMRTLYPRLFIARLLCRARSATQNAYHGSAPRGVLTVPTRPCLIAARYRCVGGCIDLRRIRCASGGAGSATEDASASFLSGRRRTSRDNSARRRGYPVTVIIRRKLVAAILPLRVDCRMNSRSAVHAAIVTACRKTT
jgi:hypothetical protein